MYYIHIRFKEKPKQPTNEKDSLKFRKIKNSKPRQIH